MDGGALPETVPPISGAGLKMLNMVLFIKALNERAVQFGVLRINNKIIGVGVALFMLQYIDPYI